jgi:hypothetical protein
MLAKDKGCASNADYKLIKNRLKKQPLYLEGYAQRHFFVSPHPKKDI